MIKPPLEVIGKEAEILMHLRTHLEQSDCSKE